MNKIEADLRNIPPDTKGQIGLILRHNLEASPLWMKLQMLLTSPHYALLHGIAMSNGKHRLEFWQELQKSSPTEAEVAFVGEFFPELLEEQDR